MDQTRIWIQLLRGLTRIRAIGILHKNSYYIMQQYDYSSGDMGKLKCGVSKRSFSVSESELHILVMST